MYLAQRRACQARSAGPSQFGWPESSEPARAAIVRRAFPRRRIPRPPPGTRPPADLAVQDVQASLDAGDGPTTSGALVAVPAERLIEGMGPVMQQLDVDLDALEVDALDGGTSESLRPRLADLRRQSIALRRQIAPQRDALDSASLTPKRGAVRCRSPDAARDRRPRHPLRRRPRRAIVTLLPLALGGAVAWLLRARPSFRGAARDRSAVARRNGC
jgi:CorA-like Mg2+ transporter protein